MKRVLTAVVVAALCTTAAQANHKGGRGGCSTGGCGSGYGYGGGCGAGYGGYVGGGMQAVPVTTMTTVTVCEYVPTQVPVQVTKYKTEYQPQKYTAYKPEYQPQKYTAYKTEWVPEQGTVVYSAASITAAGQDVALDLGDTVRLDGRGKWLGANGDVSYDMDMVRERGEWRIDAPPNRLVIPAPHFETRFQQYLLYFFDKSSQVLVPEPVYVPTGAQATTFLVNGLLQGPAPELLGVERTYLPSRTRLDDISVPVTPEGTAEVPLTDEIVDLGPEQRTHAMAQLAWTLRQVAGVRRLRVTVDGSPLLPGEEPGVPVDGWSEFDP